jgi:hypothetical protein
MLSVSNHFWEDFNQIISINSVAERLLCLQMNTDGQVQKCIFEVLHREATNVVVVCNF